MSAEGDALDEVTPDLVRRIEDGLAERRNEEVRALLAELSAAGQADVLEQISEPQRDAYRASYEWIMGALEEQVLVTVEGPRVLVPYPYCTALL